MSENIFRPLQQLARSLQAIRAPLDRIINMAFRGVEVDKAAIAHILRKEAFQKELATDWETVFYRHTNKQYVLVCTALPDNAKDAKTLTSRRLINSREACSFCGLIEGSFAPIELVEAKNPVGIPIQGERVHPRCALYWQRLKLIAEGK
ncbi:hypothetical protein [Pseudomonas sp. G5(2012)]|uniref:hypothetical protein n=1 Tax=Pseudomonas sp. G5(2012) TaxID=1268068 RepID=UPI0005B51806|nr:hypothetical protein [Pseudomonas sp. G5(2012)]